MTYRGHICSRTNSNYRQVTLHDLLIYNIYLIYLCILGKKSSHNYMSTSHDILFYKSRILITYMQVNLWDLVDYWKHRF